MLNSKIYIASAMFLVSLGLAARAGGSDSNSQTNLSQMVSRQIQEQVFKGLSSLADSGELHDLMNGENQNLEIAARLVELGFLRRDQFRVGVVVVKAILEPEEHGLLQEILLKPTPPTLNGHQGDE